MTTALRTPPARWASPARPEADSAGPRVAKFIETFCRHTKASYAAEARSPIELRLWQKELLDGLYELHPDGSRRHRRALIGLPKKNSKSFYGSALAINALVADGVIGAEVYSCAASKDQARIVFGEAKAMVQANPELSDALTIYRDAIEFVANGAVYRVLSAEAGVQDGLNPSFVLFDEVHRQPDAELWSIMSNAIGTRPNAMLVGITTAGYDRQSICYQLYDYGKKVSTGEIDDPAFFFRWWEPFDADADYTDPKVWAECNPGLGDFLSIDDFASACSSTAESIFRRYRLNQWTATHSAWLKAGAWEARKDTERTVAVDERIVVGFDGSWANDSTALVGCTLGPDKHIFVIEAWERPPTSEDPDWRVPVAEVEDAIIAACQRWDVAAVTCDPSGWKASLQRLDALGLPMIEMPNSIPRMVEATKLFETAVYEGTVTHDGDPALSRHIDNCVIKTDRRTSGQYITKEYKGSPRKIDLAIAALMALTQATFVAPKAKAPELFFV